MIACYRPKPGQEKALERLIEKHVPVLQREGLASNRKPVIMRAADGTVVEVFGWKSAEAIQKAHSHPVVLTMWEEFEAVCEYHTLSSLAEANQPFPEFTPL